MIKEVGRFNAESDTGKMYTIVTYQEMTSGWSHPQNPMDFIYGSKFMETTGSQSVTCIDSNTFQIESSGEIIHKTDDLNPKKAGLTAVRAIILFSAIGTALIIAYIIMLLLSK